MATFYLHPECEEVRWAAFGLAGGPEAEDPLDGFRWEYHGTQYRDGGWAHCFRHIRHPEDRKRRVAWVAAKRSWSPALIPPGGGNYFPVLQERRKEFFEALQDGGAPFGSQAIEEACA